MSQKLVGESMTESLTQAAKHFQLLLPRSDMQLPLVAANMRLIQEKRTTRYNCITLLFVSLVSKWYLPSLSCSPCLAACQGIGCMAVLMQKCVGPTECYRESRSLTGCSKHSCQHPARSLNSVRSKLAGPIAHHINNIF